MISRWLVAVATSLLLLPSVLSAQEQTQDETTAPLPITATPSPGALLFSDNFDNPSVGDLPRVSPQPERYGLGYLEGGYAVQIYDGTWRGTPTVQLPGHFGDAVVGVDVRIVSAEPERGVALQCREQGQRAYRALFDLRTGRTQLVRTDPRERVVLNDWVTASALRRDGSINHLELACAGDVLAVIVNGAVVVRVNDQSLSEGIASLGLTGAVGTADVRFDNLTVVQAEAAGVPQLPGPPAASYELRIGGRSTLVGAGNPFVLRRASTNVTLPQVTIADGEGAEQLNFTVDLTVTNGDGGFSLFNDPDFGPDQRRLNLSRVGNNLWQMRYFGGTNTSNNYRVELPYDGSQVSGVFHLLLWGEGKEWMVRLPNGRTAAGDLRGASLFIPGSRTVIPGVWAGAGAEVRINSLEVTLDR